MKFLSVIILFAILPAAAHAQDSMAILTLDKTVPLPNVNGRIDHMAVDVAGQRLFISALGNDTVEVVDLKTGKDIRSLPGFAEPQGMVYVPAFDRLFVANGSDGTVRILDGHSFATLRTIELGDDADNVRYDAAAKKVYAGYGSGALAALDAQTGAKVADIPLAGHPESFRLTAGASLFVNVPDAGQIAVVDRDKGAVTATWPMSCAQGNFPMYLDDANHHMFVGCRTPATVLVYAFASNGMIPKVPDLVARIPISSDTDDLFYDAANKLLYVSCGAGDVEVIKQNDADHYTKIETLPTAPGARTSLFVPELKIFCLAVPHRGSQPAEIRIYKTP
ncbi:MAG TPA: hypothetical protein VMO20_02725 [Candidatus Acidoferrum sp.]|nr:hypothetical protein [Candidatus Acidoferrum sp.]